MNKKKRRRQRIYAFLFLAPSLIGTAIFVLLPFIDAVRRSFLSSLGEKFVGFENYKIVLTNEAFILASKNTIRFMLICIPLLMILSLLLSVCLENTKKRQEGLKAIFLIPVAIPVASIVFLWKVLFEQHGVLNGILVHFNVNPIDFINSKSAFYVLLFTYLWKNIGYDMVLWISGLSNIQKEIYEAAQIDGAGSLGRFFYITLPSLNSTTILVVIISLINAFKVFREAYLISGNYPNEDIYMLQHTFNNWFLALEIQKMCAGAVIMAVVMTFIMLLLLKWNELKSR